jgi:anti-sigma B factor antagonist
MQITRRLSGETIELKVEGRLDGYWADHLAAAVDQEIRQGSHHIQLDLSQVAFLSSAGIGMLVRFYKDLKSIQGSFAVSNCSRNVLKVLELSKLVELLVAKESLLGSSESSTVETPVPKAIRQIERCGTIYEDYALAPESKLECRRLGDAGLLERCGFDKEHCRTMQFSDSTFAIGLGALGEHFEDCQGRFGEFIAAGGAVAYLPTDGTNVPDFLLAQGTTLPEVQVCYGIACHGTNTRPFGSLIRFEAKKSGESVALSLLLESCLDLADAPKIGIVMIAESAGLIGAALRRSPVMTASEPNAFQFPRIRDWLSFTAERAYTKSVVLLAGIAVRGSTDALAPVIRPFPNALSSELPVAGHFHAAAFAYRPVQRGQIDLKASIKSLFEGQALEGVLHLLSDDRSLSGGGESELVRGACWIAPISHVTTEGAQA